MLRRVAPAEDCRLVKNCALPRENNRDVDCLICSKFWMEVQIELSRF